MSSKYLTILLAVAALLLTTSCSNDDMDNLLANGPVSAQVTASINNGKSVSRVDATPAFENGDVIHVVANSLTTNDYTYSSSAWSSTSPYYFESGADVSFMGWYEGTTLTRDTDDNSIINIDTSTQTTTSGWNNWDILTTPAVTTNISTPTISFTDTYAFSHIMSKVTFIFEAGTGVSNLEALGGYTLNDIITTATFNTLTCELTPSETTSNMTIDVTEASGTEYTCTPIILIPQTLSSGTFSPEITYNDQVYTLDITLAELAEGTHYTITITINNTGLSATASIEEWTDKGTQTGTAEVPIYTIDETTSIRTYYVYDANDLEEWAAYTRDDHWDSKCTLMADIDMTGRTWTSVSSGENINTDENEDNPYTGIFDGNGKTITGLTLNYTGDQDYQGLIGYLGKNGVVKNLTMKDVSISSTQNSTGAVVGYNNDGTIINCSVSGTVTSNKARTGGVVGWNASDVIACSFTGTTITGSGNYVGGVVGYNTKGNVIACYSTGTVQGSKDYVGGVVGYTSGTCNITACYSTATVSGSSDASYVGGVLGYNNSSTISTCYQNTIESDSYSTYVDGTTITWSTASSTMNGVLDDTTYTDDDNSTYYWQYSGDGSTTPPLTLQKTATE